jgi:universal stress protein A
MKTETLEPAEANAGLVASRNDAMAPTPPIIRLKNILVPLDFSEVSLKSLQYAVPFARQFGAKLTLLHVAQPMDYTVDFANPVSLGGEHYAAIEKQLEDIRATNIPSDLQVEIAVRHNFVFDGIVEMARESHVDLIITTTHGHTGLKHLMLGSTAENIVRRAPCPVLVVRELEHDFA